MIGSNLVRRLKQDENIDVHVVDNFWRVRKENLLENGTPIISFESHLHIRDLRQLNNSLGVMKGFDEVYHLADIVAGIGYVFGHELNIFRDNLLINTNVLASAAEAGVNRLLYVGTACSYPKELQFGTDAPPLKEKDILPANPESAYGWSKLMGEYETLLYGRNSDMLTGVLRLHNVYGPGCDFSPERSQVIPALIRKAIFYPDEPFIVWGTGEQGRSFVYVDDVVDALIMMMERGLGNDPIQIGTSQSVTIHEIAEDVIKASGKQIEVIYDASKPEGDRGRCADCSVAKERLGWEPKVDLDEGIGRTYKWVQRQLSDGMDR